MNDPHVKAVYYQVITADNVDYDRAEPLTAEFDDFTLTVDQKTAVFEMKTHFGTANLARQLTEKFLRCWEATIGLEYKPGDLKFRYKTADIVDRAPPSKLVLNIGLQGSGGLDVPLHFSRNTFPPLPDNFLFSPDVETLYVRYKAYRQGREKLTSMAYMCLTVLEVTANGPQNKRKNAAAQYSIRHDVLKKIGFLCANKGDAIDARKFPQGGEFSPLTHQEKDWIEAAVKMMIRRAGEYAYNPCQNLKQITMADLPPLETP